MRNLAQNGVFRTDFLPKTQDIVLEMLLMTHQSWLHRTARGEKAMTIDEMIHAHRVILMPYIAE